MIYGYIVLLQSGVFIASKFFEKFKGTENTDITLVASGIAALANFFDRIAGNPLENVVLGDYKLAIRGEGEVIVAIFSDRNDAIAEGLAKKYAKIISKCYQKVCPNLGELDDESTHKELEKILEKLENEIISINKSAKNMQYIPTK